MTTIALLLSFTTLMSDQSLHIEPGKQLPNAITVQSSAETGDSNGTKVRFMLFVPSDYSPDGEKWPLMLFLHGLGESGDDLNRVKIHGPAKLVETRPDFPFVVVTPQCPQPERDREAVRRAWKPDELIQLVDHAIEKLNVDPQRVYVTGLSMGGFGTFRLAAAYPERFAAAVPICGGGDPETMAEPLTKVPIWAFHGKLDTTVPPERSEEMIEAIQKAGGDARLTVYPDVQHNSWAPTYENQEVYDWLLSHRKPQ